MDSIEGGYGYDQSVLNEVRNQQSALMQTLAQFQLDFEEEANKFEYTLKGMVYDSRKKVYVQAYEPIMNARGIMHVMKKVRIWMNKIVAQSYYDTNEINSWCRVYWKELTSDALFYGESWDLKFNEYEGFVRDLVFILHSMMNGAKMGGLREIVGKISKVVETSYMNVPDQKKKTVL